LRDWWLRRTVGGRITMVASTVTVLCLVLLARFAAGLVGTLLVDAADSELRVSLQNAVAAVTAGRPVSTAAGDAPARVLDRAGEPVDGGPRPVLDRADVVALDAGQGVLRLNDSPPRRWLGTVVSTPDGNQRL